MTVASRKSLLRELAQVAPRIDAAVMAVGKGDVEGMVADEAYFGDGDIAGVGNGIAIDPLAPAIGTAAGGAQTRRADCEP